MFRFLRNNVYYPICIYSFGISIFFFIKSPLLQSAAFHPLPQEIQAEGDGEGDRPRRPPGTLGPPLLEVDAQGSESRDPRDCHVCYHHPESRSDHHGIRLLRGTRKIRPIRALHPHVQLWIHRRLLLRSRH